MAAMFYFYADRGMERVAGFDELRELLRRLRGDVHLLGLANSLGLRLGDLIHFALFRQLLEQALAEDLVELVGVHLHRRQVHGVALGLALELLEQSLELGAGLGIGTHQVRDHDTHVAKLVLGDGFKEVGEGGGRDLGQV